MDVADIFCVSWVPINGMAAHTNLDAHENLGLRNLGLRPAPSVLIEAIPETIS